MTTTTKPIRPTRLTFENDADMQRFINYAHNNKKTEDDDMKRVREMMKNHRPAPKRK